MDRFVIVNCYVDIEDHGFKNPNVALAGLRDKEDAIVASVEKMILDGTIDLNDCRIRVDDMLY
jgi:hypothetical protein